MLIERKEQMDVNIELVKAKEKELSDKIQEINLQNQRREQLLKDIDDRDKKLKNLNEELMVKQRVMETSDDVKENLLRKLGYKS